MRIEDLSVVLRPRSGWEAVELGFALTRRHARTLWLTWLATTLPVLALLLSIGLWTEVLWLPPLLMWWLKPAFERAPLYVLSRGVFGAAPGVREALRGQFRFTASIWPWLLWLRLSPARSLLMPVDLLEGVSGPLRSARRSALARHAAGTAFLVMVVCAHMEAILALGLIGLLVTFTPIEFMAPASQALWETLFEAPPAWAQALLVCLYWAGVSLLAPFHVGAGFALYLNRRTEIEAWDIELGFRRLAQRSQGGGPVAGVLAAGLLATTLALAPTGPLRAAESAVEPSADRAGPIAGTRGALGEAAVDPGEGLGRRPQERFLEVFAHEYREGTDAFVILAAEVYEQDRLSPVRTQSVWLRRDRDPQKVADDSDHSWAGRAWLGSFARGLAFLLENALWLLAAALLVVLLATLRRWLPVFGVDSERHRAASARHEAEAEVAAPLPADIAAAADALWRSGRSRAALALLYVGGVERLAETSGEALPPGCTETDCLRRARALGTHRLGELFPRIVSAWQAAAYANRPPDEATFQSLLAGWRALAVGHSAEAQA